MCIGLHRLGSLALAAVCASLGMAGCQNPAGPDSESKPTTFTGTAVVVDQGVFGVAVEGEFRSDGRLRAELNWSVVAPGRGRFGTQPPDLLLDFYRDCPGSQCPGYASAGPSPTGPLSVSADVHPTSLYVVRISNRRLCGGCRIEYTLTITHPEGSMRPRPASTCPSFVVTFPGATGPRPVIDLQASPPQARLSAGERVLMAPQAVGCTFTPGYHAQGWTVSDPTVATVEDDGSSGSVYLRAERPGQTRVLVDVVQIDGSRVQGELGYCPSGLSQCTPTRLVLNVVR